MNQASQQARIDRYRRGRSTQVVNLRLPEPFTHSPQPFTGEMLQVTINVARDDSTKKNSARGPRADQPGRASSVGRLGRCRRPIQASAPASARPTAAASAFATAASAVSRPARCKISSPVRCRANPTRRFSCVFRCPAPTWSWTFERKSNDDSKQEPDA